MVHLQEAGCLFQVIAPSLPTWCIFMGPSVSSKFLHLVPQHGASSGCMLFLPSCCTWTPDIVHVHGAGCLFQVLAPGSLMWRIFRGLVVTSKFLHLAPWHGAFSGCMLFLPSSCTWPLDMVCLQGACCLFQDLAPGPSIWCIFRRPAVSSMFLHLVP